MAKKQEKVTLANGVVESVKASYEEEPMIMNHGDGSASIYYGLAQGAVIRRDDFNTTTWDSDVAKWGGESVPNDAKQRITKAVKYFAEDPLVNKSITLLAQLANDSFKIACEDKPTEDFFNQWWKDIGGNDFLGWFFLEFFRSGNVPIFKTLIPYVPQAYDPKTPPTTKHTTAKWKKTKAISTASLVAKSDYESALASLEEGQEAVKAGRVDEAVLEELNKAVALSQQTWSIKSIPGAYTILNPLSIDIEGPKDLPWLRVPKLIINDEIKQAVTNPAQEVKDIIKFIPKELLGEIKKGNDKVYLPAYLFSTVSREKQPYEPWAMPLCTPAFNALDYKKELRIMDRHTVRGVRNRILKVTIGNDNFPVLDSTELKSLAKEFNNPSRNLTVFWNHTLAIEYVEPNLDSLNMAKYEPVLEEIRTCFGISKILTGNSGESVGNNVLNLKGLVEVIAEAQRSFLTWFHFELRRVAEATSMPKMPEAKFGKLNMKDENEFIRVLATLVDRQLISYETMVETIGFHFPKELDRLRKEQQIRESDGILVPQTAPTQQSGDEGGGGGSSNTVKSPTKNGGRPSGTKEPGGRKSRVGKTRTPNGGTTSASIDPFKIHEAQGEALKKFDKCFAGKVAELHDENKRLTASRKSNIVNDSLMQVANEMSGDLNSADVLIHSLGAAQDLKEAYPDKEMYELVLSCMAYYV